MFVGGIADKLGNRYEAKWLVRQLLDVVGGKSQSLRYEGINASFKGFEFAVRRNDFVEWHQTKINNQNANWTLSALKREGVLPAIKSRLSVDEKNICVFISQDPPKDLGALADKARIASDVQEFIDAIGDGYRNKFRELRDFWTVDRDTAYRWVKRCEWKTISQSEIDSVISALSDLYFFRVGDTTFERLREFAETRFNKEITTEGIRSDIRAERKLILKDWSLDPTLKERLSNETLSYLNTYIPFGAGGEIIPREETNKIIERLYDDNRPAVILLTGVAGAGKSGVIRELIGRLAKLDIPHLGLRIDHHLDCASLKLLGKAVTDREESPAATLKGIAPDQLSVLIVDQVDAVSEVSGRNGAVKQTVLRLVDDVRNFGSVTLLIACRSFDLESDQRLKALKDANCVEHIDAQLLSWEDAVKPLLQSKSIDVAQFTEKQRELLCLPLNLAIFLETFDGTKPAFASRNDLFARLIEMKSRSIRIDRQLTWNPLVPLTELAEWMSEHQRLEAPEDMLSKFVGALDIMSSEGLIIRSRGRVNFFHESFFDYVYARSFASRQQSLESMLTNSEQHLFRRTQVRQILKTLRQTDYSRYLFELLTTISSRIVRYHIKVAMAQWLASISDPRKDEKDIVIALDTLGGPFPPLVRYALFGSAGWFDRLSQDGWLSATLNGLDPGRTDIILWWLSNIAGQRPSEITELLNNWWGGVPERGSRLLGWFGLVKRQKPDTALIDLCCRVLRSCPPGLFDAQRSSNGNMLLHTWGGQNPAGAAEVLRAYFDAWFESRPNKHPFEDDSFRELDAHSFSEIAKKAPATLIEGSISALTRSIDVISRRHAAGERDYSFKRRSYSGHHFRADAFLSLFRGAFRGMAKTDPDKIRPLLLQLEPSKHEVYTHVWLETIAANGNALHDMLNDVIESPFVFEAGWVGAKWKSFADAAREALPSMDARSKSRVEEKILSYWPELTTAVDLARRLALGCEKTPWWNKGTIINQLNWSGHEQWCLLENIGDSYFTHALRRQHAQLRRKFPRLKVPEPHHNEAHYVGSPIGRKSTAKMTNAQWLRAIALYGNDELRRRKRGYTDGGARQLSQEESPKLR